MDAKTRYQQDVAFKHIVDTIAEVCHEANGTYCATMGDMSQPEWFQAPAWQKQSAVNGVLFHLDNPDAGPEASHDSWLEQKRAEGWKYGPVKDPEKKEHPCFVPYEGLPVSQQVKDSIFLGIVHAMKRLLP